MEKRKQELETKIWEKDEILKHYDSYQIGGQEENLNDLWEFVYWGIQETNELK